MPIVELYVQEGFEEKVIAACMKEISKVIADSLENTLPQMVRVTVTEIRKQYVVTGAGSVAGSIRPTAIFQLGPGRSEPAIAKCLLGIAKAMSTHLGGTPHDACVYLNLIAGNVFSVGGKIKDFGGERL